MYFFFFPIICVWTEGGNYVRAEISCLLKVYAQISDPIVKLLYLDKTQLILLASRE